MGSSKYFYGENVKILKNKSLDNLGSSVESPEFIGSKIEERDRFIPHIDFSKPENFAKYGLAESYYEDAIKRIYQTYPYDGSLKEKVEWENSSSFLDKHIFEKEYPRTTGYATFSPDGWGTVSATSADGFYGKPSTLEYILVKGGPNAADAIFTGSWAKDTNKANIWDLSENRESNLKLGGSDGNTVEFWLKKNQWLVDSLTKREVIFDIHTTSSVSSSVNYGRLRMELTGTTTTSESSFLLTYMSGTAGFETASIGQNLGTASVGDDSWHHYAFTLINTGSDSVKASLFVDGVYNDSITPDSGTIDYVSGALIATVGALVTAPSGTITSTPDTFRGYGKLSGSVDEFRFWKVKRTPEQIGRFWFTQVGGGTNSDTANTDLGIYFKFNEGIVGSSSIDSIALDYSGRVSNGAWTGYGVNSRSTSSAMEAHMSSSSKFKHGSIKEFKDPIIYSSHTDVNSYLTSSISKGRVYDYTNTSALYLSIPSWIIEDDEKNDKNTLKKLMQIMGSYFDTLQLQIENLSSLQHIEYASASFKPLPFSEALLDSKGFVSPDVFTDSTILEQFLARGEQLQFSEELHNIKNLIYSNIYNNLVDIYKMKGTEKSFRNLIRCYGIDDELVRVNTYIDGATYTLKDNYYSTDTIKRYADFNHKERFEATVFQHTQSSNSNSISYIPGTLTEKGLAAATATITFSDSDGGGSIDYDQTITIISTDETSRTYTTKASNNYANNQFDADGGFDDKAEALKGAIEHSSGHDGKITVSRSNNVLTLTQATVGTSGNTTITENITDCVVTSFSEGTNEPGYGIAKTFEVEAVFPKKHDVNSLMQQPYPHLSASLYGMHSCSLDQTDFTWQGDDILNFQVFAVRSAYESKDVYFKLSGSSKSIFPTLTSSLFSNVYDNRKWNFAVRFKPSEYPLVQNVTGTTSPPLEYDVEFYGVNMELDYPQNEFHLSSSVTVNAATASMIHTGSHRMFLGAHRTNFTGTIADRTDVKLSSMRAWLSDIANEEVKAHGSDANNSGVDSPYRSAYLNQTGAWGIHVPKKDTLILNWNFETVDQSDTNGEFVVEDASSGSADTNMTTRYGWISNVVGRQYTGKGANFQTSTTASIDREYLYIAKKSLPEAATSHDMINILTDDDDVFTRDTEPNHFYFSVEKSMYNVISDEMIKIFSTIKDFNNLVGEPVNRYRQDYKDLGKLRTLFFEKIGNTPDLDRYVDFYKWVDNSLTIMLQELIPATANFSEKLRTMVESHVLERNKYWNKFPTMESKLKDPEAPFFGISELLYPWKFGHHPINSETNHGLYWKQRALRSDSTLASGDSNVDSDKNEILRVQTTNSVSGSTYVLRNFSKPYRFTLDQVKPIYQGSTFYSNKKIDFYKPVTKFQNFLNTNKGYIEALVSSLDLGPNSDVNDYNDLTTSGEGITKKRFIFKATTRDLNSYFDTKEGIPFPFTMISSSVSTGYMSSVVSDFGKAIEFSGIHTDAYLDSKEMSLQSPFTEKYVGGKQHRHIALNVSSSAKELDTAANRPEGWKLRLTKEAQATATITFYGSIAYDQTITIISTDGTSVTYTAKAANDYASNEFDVDNGFDDKAEALKGAIEHSSGHGSKITVSQGGSGNARLTLTQVVAGPDGNNTVTENLGNTTVTGFTDGEVNNIRLYGPDVDSVHHPRATNYRDEFANRPVNIRNIRQSTGSTSTIIGNYTHDYEVFNTVSRKGNNRALIKNEGYILVSANSPHISGVMDYKLPDRSVAGTNKYVITERFSAPGGPETSAGFLDIESGEYSVYNALPFRNLIRAYGGEGALYNQLTQHCGPFGFSSFSDHVGSWYTNAVSASYHKVNRNPITSPKITTEERFNLYGAPTSPSDVTHIHVVDPTDPGGIKAFVTFSFDQDTYNSTDGASLALTSNDGTIRTFTIKTDGTAIGGRLEFDSGASHRIAADNFVALLNSTFGRKMTASATNGAVTITQGYIGADGNQSISKISWDDLTLVNVGATFSGGTNLSTLNFTDGTRDRSFSINAWVEMNTAVNAPIVDRQRSTYSLFTDSDRKLNFRLYDSTNNAYIQIQSDSLAAHEGKRTLLTATYDGVNSTRGMKLYVNGSLLSTVSSTSGNYATMRIHSTYHNLSIGARNQTLASSDPPDVSADGTFDDVSIWETELSSREVTEVYTDGYHPSPRDLTKHSQINNLISWWRMGDNDSISAGTFDTVTDQRGSNDASTKKSPAGVLMDVNILPTQRNDEIYTIDCEKEYDNWWVQHHIPRRNATAYHWITSSIEVSGCADYSFLTASDSGIGLGNLTLKATEYAASLGSTINALGLTWDTAVDNWFSFMPKELNKSHNLNGLENTYFRDYSAEKFLTEDSWIQTDFVGLNTTIYEPITSSTNTLGYDASVSLLNLPNIKVAQENADKSCEYHVKQGTLLLGGNILGEGFWVDASGDPASTTFTFDETNHNSVAGNNASITLEDTNGKKATITIKTDGSAQANVFDNTTDHQQCEFNSGDNVIATTNHFQEVFDGNFTGLSFLSVSFLDSGKVTFVQLQAGALGNTAVATSNWDAICSVNVVNFTGGVGGEIAASGGEPFHKGIGAALVLNPLLHHRNGPYQYPSWKQIRGGEHPVMRHLKKRNVLSIIKVFKVGDETKPGSVIGYPEVIYNYIEPVITSKFKPMVHKFDVRQFGFEKIDPMAKVAHMSKVVPEVVLNHTYANNLCTFTYNKAAGYTHPITGFPSIGENLLIHDMIGYIDNKQTIQNRLQYPEPENGTQIYSNLKQIYVGDGIPRMENPMNSFRYMKYSEVIYPKESLTYMSKIRRRLNYTEKNSKLVSFEHRTFWAKGVLEGAICDEGSAQCDTLSEFRVLAANNPGIRPTGSINSQGFAVGNNAIYAVLLLGGAGPESVWPLAPLGELKVDHRSTALRPEYAAYPIGYTASANYTHTLPYVGNLGLESWTWNASSQAENTPWYDTYEEYSEELRLVAKDHSILPEFRISDHMEFYDENGFDLSAQNKSVFTIFGAGAATGSIRNQQLPADLNIAGFFDETTGAPLASDYLDKMAIISSSANYPVAEFNNEFFRIYAHTDFLKYFELIYNEHKAAPKFFPPSKEEKLTSEELVGYKQEFYVPSISMRCDAIKKLLPYNGFYPVNRTLQLASLFHKAMVPTKTPYTLPILCSSGSSTGVSEGYEALLQPFFSPGIMYNTIKSGIAVDWPLWLSQTEVQHVTGKGPDDADEHYGYITNEPETRLPFEALYEPEEHLPAGKTIYMAYPNAFSGSSQTKFAGSGDSLGSPDARAKFLSKELYQDVLYGLAMNNFLATIPDFFLKRRGMTTFASKPKNMWGSIREGTFFKKNVTYHMDIVLHKPDDLLLSEGPFSTGSLARPSWFRGSIYGPPVEFASTNLLATLASNTHNVIIGDPAYAPFTPPYFYGAASASISYKHDLEGQPDLDYIFEKATVKYGNDYSRASYGAAFGRGWTMVSLGSSNFSKSALKNEMNVSASVNIFGKTRVPKIKYDIQTEQGAAIDDPNSEHSKFVDSTFTPSTAEEGTSEEEVWTIGTKFECPILTRDHPSLNSSFHAREQPVGMWMDYCSIPTGRKGIYLELKESPLYQADSIKNGSLIKTCGFNQGTRSSQKLGQLANSTTIHEAVIAIPFFDLGGLKKLIKIDRDMYETQKQNYLSPRRTAIKVGDYGRTSPIKRTSITRIIKAMKKYVFPPAFDFVNNPEALEEIGPFAMYIMEFKQKLDKQDLSDIWQGLMPKAAKIASKDSATFSHKIGKFEMITSDVIFKYSSRLRWMVFKVKQRANYDFYKLTKKDSDDNRFKFPFKVGNTSNLSDSSMPYSFNWPYDFCTIVEMVKLEASPRIRLGPKIPINQPEAKGFMDLTEEDYKRLKEEFEAGELSGYSGDVPVDFEFMKKGD